MLFLLSFALVLAATALLVLGLLADGGISLIYVSIALSVASGVVLFAATRMMKPREAVYASGPAPLSPEPAPVSLPQPAAPEPAPPPPTAVTPVGEWQAADHDWQPAGEWEEVEEGEAVEFPLADYDELTVSEVMPLLPQLYADELDVVAARERAGKARAAVLSEIARLRDEAGDAEEPDVEDAGAEVAAPAPAAPADDDDDDFFPIEEYDKLPSSEILAALGELDDAELREVRAHEAATQARRTVLTNIDRRLAPLPQTPRKATASARRTPAPAPSPPAPAPKARTRAAAPTPATKAAPARKVAPAKKVSAVKKVAAAKKVAPAPAKKVAAAKKAAPAPMAEKAAPAPVKKATKRSP